MHSTILHMLSATVTMLHTNIHTGDTGDMAQHCSVNPAIKFIKCALAASAIEFWISSEVILLSSCRTVNNASCRLSLKIQLVAKVFREDKHLAMIDGCSVARTYPLLTDGAGAGAGSYRCAVQDTDTHLGQCSAVCSADTTTTRPLLSANTN